MILCYKLNEQLLSSERGGPVRIVVPEAYGFKSIKWLSHVVITNMFHANDTYADGNNDIDSWLKTFAATLSVTRRVKPGGPIAVTGYAQVGISGLSRVQVWVSSDDDELPVGDPYFTQAPWQDAEILPPPSHWGGDLPDGKIPGTPLGFDAERASRVSGPCDWRKHTGPFCCPVCPPGITRCDVGPLTRRATLSPCRVRSINRDVVPSRKFLWWSRMRRVRGESRRAKEGIGHRSLTRKRRNGCT